MQTQNLISADEFCIHHQVEYSFINSLQEYGLIEVKIIDESRFIDEEKLFELEKFVRLRYDLDINLEGIEAITFLLKKVTGLQAQVNVLKNKLSLYEDVE